MSYWSHNPEKYDEIIVNELFNRGLIDMTYKENLIQNATYQMEIIGGKVRVSGKGNNRHINFKHPNGQTCVVWFPEDSRVNDVEIKDIKEAILEMSGKAALQEDYQIVFP